MTEPNQLPVWRVLARQADYYGSEFDLRTAFSDQPQRFGQLSLRAPFVFADLSKQLWDVSVLAGLLELARTSGLSERQKALLTGQIVNDTERRPAQHVQLRRAVVCAPQSCEPLCRGVNHMLQQAEQIRRDSNIHDIVHIGIGGSGLGPELAVQALQPFKTSTQRLHFVSNLDGQELHEVLQHVRPAHTLFVVASKSWSTAETLCNARSALQWFQQQGGADIGQHFLAITARAERAHAMGFAQVLDLPEGVGGRFSLWSAIGLPIAVALGEEGFRQMLQGAVAMDRHFECEPLSGNLPVWLGLLDVWNSTFLHMASRCVVPYHHGLRRLPAYLQQLEMESNGKRVHRDGSPVNYSTSASVWGEPGTNGQHAFFQWLHQGTGRVPVEFIAVKRPAHSLTEHQVPLLTNAFAQAQALMQGATAVEGQIPGHQDFPGNRPSSFLLLNDLSSASFGALLALQEHRAFVAGTVWGVNSFDQWGVELGKTLAKDLQQCLVSGKTDGLDASTAGLLALLRAA
ncbi:MULTISPECIES: glucose-6-phosphate isomerase [unclassified Diaphorobacter]|uniref:glucose-6-phosphate isomerase n=1 Tax=unclassified Diaphorobacter TaxID=2649760 RepID=UPI0022DE3C39|nr:MULTISPECIES: glucose-6-phosphate isomerase [unclassified Diaphorobacter]